MHAGSNREGGAGKWPAVAAGPAPRGCGFWSAGCRSCRSPPHAPWPALLACVPGCATRCSPRGRIATRPGSTTHQLLSAPSDIARCPDPTPNHPTRTTFTTPPPRPPPDHTPAPLSQMLERNPAKRVRAADALRHPWLTDADTSPALPLRSSVVQRLQRFATYGHLKQVGGSLKAPGMDMHRRPAVSSAPGFEPGASWYGDATMSCSHCCLRRLPHPPIPCSWCCASLPTTWPRTQARRRRARWVRSRGGRGRSSSLALARESLGWGLAVRKGSADSARVPPQAATSPPGQRCVRCGSNPPALFAPPAGADQGPHPAV